MRRQQRGIARGIPYIFTMVALLGIAVPALAATSVEEYMDLPLEDLLSLQVVSVSKKKQRLSEVASAVFVITAEDIRRSGVTSIPEALRMAPGIHVARIDANKWVITSRGFGSQFSNKLLVMIDGRTVYSPSYSGVYWDAQDTMLEDIDRIEVIRGPGASVWGANAVNGVINIITRQAAATPGGLAVAGGGNEERAFAALRYGSSLGERTDGRIYLKYTNRDDSWSPEFGDDAGDHWQRLSAGFRVDGHVGTGEQWTLQGDAYTADEHQLVNLWKDPDDPASSVYGPFFLEPAVPDAFDSSGMNLLGKWDHRISDTAAASLQVYYDHTRRSEVFITQTHDTLDLDFQHQFQPLPDHDLIWGLGYRLVRDDFDNSFMVSFLPDSRSLNLLSAFLQDEIQLLPDTLRLILGSKFEHNDYTGFEVQPTARLVWRVNGQTTFWGAVSRAVRTPSRLEADSSIISQIFSLPPDFTPTVSRVHGNDDFTSEDLIAWELGYRVQPRDNISLDISMFYNDYDNLQTFEQVDPTMPLADSVFGNRMSARTWGLEMSLDWRPLEWWRLQGNYSFLDVSASLDDDSRDLSTSDQVVEGSSPKHQFSLRSMMDLGHGFCLDLWLYHIGELEKSSYSWTGLVPGYTSFNARLAWRPVDRVEISLVGQNLNHGRHLEFIGENLYQETEVERSLYAMVRLNF
ncbi:TonB-dependent receptor plug domain-containing protein [Thermodesulfobacteriota bacterium B35]